MEKLLQHHLCSWFWTQASCSIFKKIKQKRNALKPANSAALLKSWAMSSCPESTANWSAFLPPCVLFSFQDQQIWEGTVTLLPLQILKKIQIRLPKKKTIYQKKKFKKEFLATEVLQELKMRKLFLKRNRRVAISFCCWRCCWNKRDFKIRNSTTPVATLGRPHDRATIRLFCCGLWWQPTSMQNFRICLEGLDSLNAAKGSRPLFPRRHMSPIWAQYCRAIHFRKCEWIAWKKTCATWFW